MRGFILTEQEKKQIRTLYTNKGFIIEQKENTGTTITDCVTVEVIGSFDAMETEDSNNIKNFILKLNTEISKNETLKKAYDDGKLYVDKINLLGGASNRYGGKVVKPTMDNNYNPKTYTDDSKYTGDFNANLTLAENRAKNVWVQLQKILQQNKITINKGVEPTYEKYVIDTNGAIDKTNEPLINSGKYNPGQIVKMSVDLCGTGGGGEEPKTCFESAVIEVHFEGDKPGNVKHDCNKAVYEIYANGVLLNSRTGNPWASLNNDPNDKTNSTYTSDNKKDRFRYNYFDITADGVNEQFLNNGVWNKYDGKLLISAKCIQPSTPWGTDNQKKINAGYNEKQHCHPWVGDIKFSSKSISELEIKAVGPSAESLIPGVTLSTPDEQNVLVNVATFDACSSLFTKK